MAHYDKLAPWMRENKVDALLVSNRNNIRYFSGFGGSAGVLAITPGQRKIFVDFRYLEQALQTAVDFETVRCQGNPLDGAVEFLQLSGAGRIGFENETMTVAEFSRLTEKIAAEKWIPVHLDGLRSVKTAAEIGKISAAAAIADEAFARILPMIRPGVAERTLAASLEYEMKVLGSERTAFETIFASGPRSALPHGLASEKVIESGDLVVVDFGAVFQGYHSDMTRTVCVGNASLRQHEVYETVLSAQLAGLAAVRPGALCRDVDKVARDIIAAAGFGQYFGHGLGHCVGLAIHENPRLSVIAGEARLEPGMVVTVEPGIYLPGWGGVRIEDLVEVTESGCRILSQTSKAFLELI